MLAAERLEHGSRIHVDRRHHRLFDRYHAAKRFPTLVDLLDRRHVGHRAAGRHVGQNDRLVASAQDIGSFAMK